MRLLLAGLLIAAALVPPVGAQSPMDPVAPPMPPPPGTEDPVTEEEAERDAAGDDPSLPQAFPPESDLPWGLPDKLLERLSRAALRYREHALSFECRETVRQATYTGGEATKETTQRYRYLLTRDERGAAFRELRQRVRKSGKIEVKDSEDAEPFPPAYGWVFLFSEFHRGFFAYRDLGTGFDGFDHVRRIQFKGALPFDDGKDIRQWEGIVTVDASTLTPLEIRAVPSGQSARVRAMYKQWARAFNIIGFRLAPRPFGYRCRVKFRTKKRGLTFPTELRYDTYRQVGPRQIAPIRASIREYGNYRFFEVDTLETIGKTRN